MRSIIALGLLMAVGAGQAVHVNPNGTGQVLIYPLYRTDNGFDTLLSVTNDSNHPKALVVRAQEGLLGQDVLNFHLYLKAFGTWTGAITQVNGGPGIVAGTSSCSVPAFPATGQPFSDVLLSDDPAPNDSSRLNYGMVQIIEMGELSGEAADLVNDLDCVALEAAWLSGGFWRGNPGVGMEPPGGGLSGNAWLVDVADGTAHSYVATALDNFADQHLNTTPGQLTPDLGSATPETSGGKTVSTIFTESGATELLWDNPVDAVSAALTASAMATDFTLIESISAETQVWITAPTFRHHVSALYAPVDDPPGPFTPPTRPLPRAPFQSVFGADGAPTSFQVDLVSRNGNSPRSCETISNHLPPSGIDGIPQLVAAVNPVIFSNEVLFSLPSDSNWIRPGLFAGRAAFSFGPEAEKFAACNEVDLSQRLSNLATVRGGELDGRKVRLSGLPVLGVTLTSVSNGTLTDESGQAVLSNYGVEFQPRRKVVVID